MDRSHALRRDLFGADPDDGGRDQLQICYQLVARCTAPICVRSAELQHGGDQADSERGEQLVDIVQIRISDVSNEEAELSVTASSTKKPKMTVSRFMSLLSGQTAGAWSPMLEVSSCLTPGWDRDPIA